MDEEDIMMEKEEMKSGIHGEIARDARGSDPDARASEPCCDTVGCCCEAASPSPLDERAVHSCADDAREATGEVVVELLALDLSVCDRCCGTDERVATALERCRPVLSAYGYDARLDVVIVKDEQMARKHRFYSSPSIRVNGVDICASIEENDCACCSDMSDAAVKCRLFPFDGEYYEVPPTDMVIQGIIDVVLRGKRAPSPELPYQLPDNLARFFAGVRSKDAGDSDSATCCCGSSCC